MSRTDAHRPKRVLQHFALVKFGHIADGSAVPAAYERALNEDNGWYLLTEQQELEFGIIHTDEEERYEQKVLMSRKVKQFPTVKSQLADMTEYTWADYLVEDYDARMSALDRCNRPAGFTGTYTVGEPIIRFGQQPKAAPKKAKAAPKPKFTLTADQRRQFQARVTAHESAKRPTLKRDTRMPAWMRNEPVEVSVYVPANRVHKVA
jgi:hypothetical protein